MVVLGALGLIVLFVVVKLCLKGYCWALRCKKRCNSAALSPKKQQLPAFKQPVTVTVRTPPSSGHGRKRDWSPCHGGEGLMAEALDGHHEAEEGEKPVQAKPGVASQSRAATNAECKTSSDEATEDLNDQIREMAVDEMVVKGRKATRGAKIGATIAAVTGAAFAIAKSAEDMAEDGAAVMYGIGSVAIHVPWVKEVFGLLNQVGEMFQAVGDNQQNIKELMRWTKDMQGILVMLDEQCKGKKSTLSESNARLINGVNENLVLLLIKAREHKARGLFKQFTMSKRLEKMLMEVHESLKYAIHRLTLGLNTEIIGQIDAVKAVNLQIDEKIDVLITAMYDQQVQLGVFGIALQSLTRSISASKVDASPCNSAETDTGNYLGISPIASPMMTSPATTPVTSPRGGGASPWRTKSPSGCYSSRTTSPCHSSWYSPHRSYSSLAKPGASSEKGARKECKRSHESKVERVLQGMQISLSEIHWLEGGEIGTGEFGSVHKLEMGGTIFAGKVIQLKGLTPAQKQKIYLRFCKELVNLSKVQSHQCVVSTRGVVTTADELVLVMEYMEEGSLRGMLDDPERLKGLRSTMKYQIMYDVASGLQHIHKEGVLHRDIKSANVLISRAGSHNIRARITDFGTSKTLSAMSSFSDGEEMMGSLAWVPPEVFISPANYCAKSDVYSYALVLWEIENPAAGLPWAHMNVAEVMPKVLSGMRPPFSDGGFWVIRKLIRSCWNTEMEARPGLSAIINCLAPLVPDPFTASSRSSLTPAALAHNEGRSRPGYCRSQSTGGGGAGGGGGSHFSMPHKGLSTSHIEDLTAPSSPSSAVVRGISHVRHQSMRTPREAAYLHHHREAGSVQGCLLKEAAPAPRRSSEQPERCWEVEHSHPYKVRSPAHPRSETTELGPRHQYRIEAATRPPQGLITPGAKKASGDAGDQERLLFNNSAPPANFTHWGQFQAKGPSAAGSSKGLGEEDAGWVRDEGGHMGMSRSSPAPPSQRFSSSSLPARREGHSQTSPSLGRTMQFRSLREFEEGKELHICATELPLGLAVEWPHEVDLR
ncbi:unnamed protein product [Chrysoparadoxa australica]